MESLRKWFYRPKRDDRSLLAQFFFADEALNMVASELDSFDGRKDPERCTLLVNQLRQSQDKVLTIINTIMDILIKDERANRDFRVKFPEDVLQDNLAGQLWFGAECLAAGSCILNRENESTAMRPLARALTKSLDTVRNMLRETCLRSNTPNGPLKLNSNELITEVLVESLKIFDRLFAEFELCYVSAMVPVKSVQEYELQQLIGVLFSETLQRALRMDLLTQDMIDACDPALMFTIPRLAIIGGLLMCPNGPLCIDKPVEVMSEMFRPFRTLLHKIRELLWSLTKRELYMLEKLLCDNEQLGALEGGSAAAATPVDNCSLDDDAIELFYADYPPWWRDYITRYLPPSESSEKTVASVVARSPSLHRAIAEESDHAETPSTSQGYLITNTVDHDAIVASLSDVPESIRPSMESLPDQDSLDVISEAAATLSTIISTTVSVEGGGGSGGTPSRRRCRAPKPTSDATSSTSCCDNAAASSTTKKEAPESPLDSGICTAETTSLDRSPSQEEAVGKGSTPASSRRTRSTEIIIEHLHYQQQKTRAELTNGEEGASGCSSDTSSFNSNCADYEEIALAIQAVEIACRNEVRSKFRSSEDLLHRLFVCIAGVADQLQTNFASDLRNILKAVFLMNASESVEELSACDSKVVVQESDSVESSMEYRPPLSQVIENGSEFTVDPNILAQEALFDTGYFQSSVGDDLQSDGHNHEVETDDGHNFNEVTERRHGCGVGGENSTNDDEVATSHQERPPVWIPDIEAPRCMSCGATFTVVKRRHHCRNCGKIFCARCSANSVPLPKFGHIKPVRVCNKCFMYQLMPFTM